MKTLRLILGDQLNINHTWFNKVDDEVCYVLMEVKQEQDYVKHHVQKIIAFFSAMRNFAKELRNKGHKVIYLKIDDEQNKQSFAENLQAILQSNAIEKLEYLLPDEYRLDDELKAFCKGLSIPSRAFDTEHFYTQREFLADFFKGKKTFLMESFYRSLRKKHAILMDGEEPLTGRWNYDAENRKKYDGKVPVPNALTFKSNQEEIFIAIQRMKISFFGRVDAANFDWPCSRTEALQVLDYFVKNLLPYFGTYEDALSTQHINLFHSRLSFVLNLKLLSPQEVVNAVQAEYHSNNAVDIAQAEGFIRQVLGWREYMRGVYWAKMPGYAQLNFLEQNQELPNWFWDGNTQMNCLKQCINNSLDNAYAHHIQRLMVIGNFCLLANIHPNYVDAWYLGVYIDAIEWVQITNTRGMSQYADGGIVGSKPYVSSANYIDKMSDYCSGCIYDKKKRYGENACPINSFYWDFYIRHREKLASNPRIGMMYRLIDKMSADEVKNIQQKASYYKSIIHIV